jgi:GNAT superfamily N-acetyltransferase
MRNGAIKLWGAVRDLAYLMQHERREIGPWLAAFLRSFLYNRIDWIVYTRSLEGHLPSIEVRLLVTYLVAGADDFARLRELVLPSEFARLGKRLAHGRICALALYQGRVVGYLWITDEVNFEIDNLQLRLGPGDVYFDDAYTVPAYRNQGVYTALHLQGLRDMQGRGFQRAVSIVDVGNLPSRRVHEKLGYQEADRLFFRRILIMRQYRYQNGRF